MNPVNNRLSVPNDNSIFYQMIKILFYGNISGKHNLDRKPTFSELSIGEFSTLM
jgi:hypothetical protein